MKKNFNITTLLDTPILATIALLINGVLWLLVYTLFPKDLPAAILHYNVAVGIDFVGEGKQVFMLPAVGLSLVVLNTVLAYMLRSINLLAGRLLLGSAILAQLLLIAGFVAILAINT